MRCVIVFTLGAVAPHLQQRPFITLGALVAFLLLSIHGVVDSGEVVAEYGQHGPVYPPPPFSGSPLPLLIPHSMSGLKFHLRLKSWKLLIRVSVELMPVSLP